MPLVPTRRHLRNSALVNLSHPPNSLLSLLNRRALLSNILQRPFLKPRIIKPDVVVPTIMRELLLVLDSSLAEHGRLERGSRSVLFFKLGVGGVQRVGF